MERSKRVALIVLMIAGMGIWVSIPSAARAPSQLTVPTGFLPLPTRLPSPQIGVPGPRMTLPTEIEPTPSPTATPKPTPKPTPRKTITGKASWYCNLDDTRYRRSVCHYKYLDRKGPDLYAAACEKLRRAMGGAEKFWRNKFVTVTGNNRSVVVQLVDYCESKTKTIDLYRDAADVLGYSGTLEVRVSW